MRRGGNVTYTDPYVPSMKHAGHEFHSVGEKEALNARPDCAVICTDHGVFDWKALVSSGVPVVDTRNALRGFSAPTIVRLSGRAAPIEAPV